MKVTFFSNYFNHHQRALCEAFFREIGDGFTFVETEPMESFRVNMGWGVSESPSFVLKTHESDENKKKALELGLASDVVIMGTAPEYFIRERLKADRLTFRYSERPLKEGRVKVLIPRLFLKFYRNHYKNRNKRLYCLCAGAYVSSDYKFLHSYIGKCYKFGYFPAAESLPYESIRALRSRRSKVRILWAGRFLKLKRADLFIEAARRCRERGYDFEVVIVGDGKEEKRLKKLVVDSALQGRTVFKGYLSPTETRNEMERADIFVMTSNRLEGWGSVIYEALSAGCACIASHAAGAAPFLIGEGRSGLMFKSDDIDSLTKRLEYLLKNPDKMREMGEEAYYNMKENWNPTVAATRLLELSESLINGQEKRFRSGPLSPCEDLYMDWYHEPEMG